MKKLLGGLVLASCLFLGYRFYRLQKATVWHGQRQLNLVIQASPVGVVSFQPKNKRLVALLIPDEVYLEAAYGYGTYRAGSIYALGELDQQGGQLLAASIQEYLGLPVDGWLAAALDWEKEIESLKKTLWDSRETNLCRWDTIRLWWFLKTLRPDQLVSISLAQTTAAQPLELADGEKALEIDPQKVDQVISQYFQDEQLVSEGLALAVVNATGQPGLAARGARLIGNAGGRVVDTDDWPNQQVGCEIRGSQEVLAGYTAQRLQRIFDCRLGSDELAGRRADLVVILGDR